LVLSVFTAFGILYDFQAGSSGVNVTAPAKMVNETWFLEAIEERPDFFVLVGQVCRPLLATLFSTHLTDTHPSADGRPRLWI
jgi:hypothetical protein